MSTLRRALLPGGDPTAGGGLVDITVTDGRVTALTPSEDAAVPLGPDDHDLAGRLVLASFAEPHAHLDKALSADVVANPAGDLPGAVDAWMRERALRPVEDFIERADAAVAVGAAKGVTAIRSHVDMGSGIELKGLEALLTVRERWAGEVSIQLVGLTMPFSGPEGAKTRDTMREALHMGLDLIGGVPAFEPDPTAALATVLDLAEEFSCGVDLHVDEALDLNENTVVDLADMVAQRETPNVTASHVVSLGMRPPEDQQRIAQQIARANINVVTLPQTNLFLQARGMTTAPPRGLTALDALADAGVTVAAGGDNLQDPFNLMGRGDPLETASLLVVAGHRTPDQALAAVSGTARSVMGLDAAGPAVGQWADLIAIHAPSARAAMASADDDRMTFVHGRLTFHTSNTVHRSRQLG